jgi:hypothetical protein
MLRLWGAAQGGQRTLEGISDVSYEEPDLTGGVEGVDYTIAYGVSKAQEDESN